MEHNPFVAPDTDPRARAIQQAREDQKVGVGAAVSLVPNWDELKALTLEMAKQHYSAFAIADAVENPEKYWEYVQAAKAQEAMNNGE